MRLLCIGDVVGGAGRRVVSSLLPRLVRQHGVDLVVANGENLAGGVGVTAATAEEMFAAGVGVVTGGNHTWKHKEALAALDREPRLVRPYNYPAGAPGRGLTVVETPPGPVAERFAASVPRIDALDQGVPVYGVRLGPPPRPR